MNDDFEKTDKAWLDLTKNAREAQVPPGILKDFSADVQRRILERRAQAAFLWGAGLGLFALALFAAAVFFLWPQSRTAMLNAPAVKAEIPALKESDIVSEIEALKELGIWTDEDETAVGVPLDTSLSDLEMGLDSDPSITLAPSAQL